MGDPPFYEDYESIEETRNILKFFMRDIRDFNKIFASRYNVHRDLERYIYFAEEKGLITIKDYIKSNNIFGVVKREYRLTERGELFLNDDLEIDLIMVNRRKRNFGIDPPIT